MAVRFWFSTVFTTMRDAATRQSKFPSCALNITRPSEAVSRFTRAQSKLIGEPFHRRPGSAGQQLRCVLVRSVRVGRGGGVSASVQRECIRNATGGPGGGEVVWREGRQASSIWLRRPERSEFTITLDTVSKRACTFRSVSLPAKTNSDGAI